MISLDDEPSNQGSGQKTHAALAELQSRVAFQEDTLQALNQVIAEQDAKLIRLHKQVQLLNDKLNDLSNAVDQGAGSDDQEVPPHY